MPNCGAKIQIHADMSKYTREGTQNYKKIVNNNFIIFTFIENDNFKYSTVLEIRCFKIRQFANILVMQWGVRVE